MSLCFILPVSPTDRNQRSIMKQLHLLQHLAPAAVIVLTYDQDAAQSYGGSTEESIAARMAQ